MKLVLTWNKDNFIILDGANNVEINLPPLTADSGVGEFDFTISSRLERDMTNLFTNELNGDIKQNKAKYESWNSYNSLPPNVKNALAAGISFNSDIIGIPNVNTFANIIDTEKTVITKGVFPGHKDTEIEPIQIKLVLKAGRFVKIGGSLASELPIINISNLPNAEALAYIFIEKESQKISNFIKIIEDSINKEDTYEGKKNIYDGYHKYENFPLSALAEIATFSVKQPDYSNEVLLETLLESKIIFSKGTFPSGANEPIPPIIVELILDKASRVGKDGIYYKILPIAINFTGMTS